MIPTPGHAPSELVIFGTGSLAQLLALYLERDSSYDVVAFTATDDRIDASVSLGRPVVPYEKITDSYPPSQYAMFVAVGYQRMNKLRAHFYYDARGKGYQLVSYVSSEASTAPETLQIGDNCCVFGPSTIEPFARLGNDVVVWSGAHIAHHSTIGDHSFLGPHALVAGHTRIGEYCFLGANSTVRDSISVADECLIGAGALILSDTSVGDVYTGVRSPLSSSKSTEFFQ